MQNERYQTPVVGILKNRTASTWRVKANTVQMKQNMATAHITFIGMAGIEGAKNSAASGSREAASLTASVTLYVRKERRFFVSFLR